MAVLSNPDRLAEQPAIVVADGGEAFLTAVLLAIQPGDNPVEPREPHPGVTGPGSIGRRLGLIELSGDVLTLTEDLGQLGADGGELGGQALALIPQPRHLGGILFGLTLDACGHLKPLRSHDPIAGL